MPANKVVSGPFVGKSAAELKILLREAQAELGEGGGSLIGASLNGQSIQKTAGPSVLSRIRLLTQALAQVDPDFIAPSATIRVRFGGCS